MGESTFNEITWEKLYSARQIKKWGLPIAHFQDAENGIFRDLFLNWTQFSKKISNIDLPVRRICCDVLQLDGDIVLNIDAIIYARKIILKNNASVIIDHTGFEGQNPGLTLFAQEVVDFATGESRSLVIQRMESENDIPEFVFAPQRTVSGVAWTEDNESPVPLHPTNVDPQELLRDEPLQLFLINEFQVATLLSTEYPQLSIDQLQWIGEMARAGDETQDLIAQALSLATNLTEQISRAGDSLLIPQLDYAIYGSKASACMELLRARASSWRNLQQTMSDKEQWAADATAFLNDNQIQSQLNRRLQDQAQTARDQALYSRNLAAQQVVYERAAIDGCRIAYKRGIQYWEQEGIAKEAVKIALAVGDVAYQVGTVVAAGPEIAAIPALKKTADTTKAVMESVLDIMTESGQNESSAEPPSDAKNEEKEKVKSAKKTLNKAAKSLGEDGKGIVEAAINICGIVQKANKLVNTSAATVEMVDDTTGRALASDYLSELDTVTGGSQDWDKLSIETDAIFDKIRDYDIEGKTEFQNEIRRLIVMGKVYGETQLALAKANAELAEKKLRTQAAEKAVRVFQKRFEVLKEDIAEDETIAALLFNKVLDSKRAIYLAVEAYQRAFAYYTLVDKSQWPALPKITDSVDDFGRAVSNITGDALVVSRLGKLPQSMGNGQKTGPSFVLNDKRTIESMKKYCALTWQLPVTASSFRNFCRVRLSCIRVFLEGVQSDENIEIKVATSGVYKDKMPTVGDAIFVGKPMRFNFVYKGNEPERIIFDGDIAGRHQNDFYHPTPFTTWTFKVQKQDGSQLDLSGLEGIRIEFGGEATSRNN